MDLKEKILDTENNKPDEMATSWITVDRQSALKAMDELSKIVAIAFAKWINDSEYVFCIDGYYRIYMEEEQISEHEIYDLFTQSKEYKELMNL
mgnify:CR=1 FL=1